MIDKIKTLCIGMTLVLGFTGATVLSPITASAANVKSNVCGGADLTVNPAACSDGTAEENTLNKLIANIVNILSIIVGIVAVIMIIIGGFKYITSAGDSGNISSAKTTIIYAIVGLIIVALAQVIVRFVLAKAT